MVYNGPSLGCFKCRRQHTRCDLTRPACLKCQSHGHECPGYRDVPGFIFKNVTDDVAAKQVKQAARLRRAQHTGFETDHDNMVMKRAAMPKAPRLDLSATSVAFFVNKYVIHASQNRTLSGGHFDHLHPLLSRTSPSSPLAKAVAIMATKAACLFFRQDRNHVAIHRNEMEAAKAINDALADPEECVRDETLLAILCFDLAERISPSQSSRQALTDHAKGALALVHYRGSGSFNNEVSRSLLTATTSNAVFAVLQQPGTQTLDSMSSLPTKNAMDQGSFAAGQQLLARALTIEQLLTRHADRPAVSDGTETLLSWIMQLEEILGHLSDWVTHFRLNWTRMLYVTQQDVGEQLRDDQRMNSASIYFMQRFGHCCLTRLTTLRLLYLAHLQVAAGAEPSQFALSSILMEAEAAVGNLIVILKNLKAFDSNRPYTTDPVEEILVHTVGFVPASGFLGTNSGEFSLNFRLVLVRWALLVLTDKLTPGFGVGHSSMAFLQHELQEVHSRLENAGCVFAGLGKLPV